MGYYDLHGIISVSYTHLVSFLERGKIVLVINMSVSSIKGSSVYRKNTDVYKRQGRLKYGRRQAFCKKRVQNPVCDRRF